MFEASEEVQKVLSPNEFPREVQKFLTVFALCCTCSYRLVFDYLRSYSQPILGHLAQRACRHNCCVRNVLLWSRRNCLIEAGCATPRSMPPSLEDILNSKANGCLSLELVGFFKYTLKSLYFWL